MLDLNGDFTNDVAESMSPTSTPVAQTLLLRVLVGVLCDEATRYLERVSLSFIRAKNDEKRAEIIKQSNSARMVFNTNTIYQHKGIQSIGTSSQGWMTMKLKHFGFQRCFHFSLTLRVLVQHNFSLLFQFNAKPQVFGLQGQTL